MWRHAKHSNRDTHVLITGGAGFIGTNLADRLLSSGKEVIIYDNLTRPGVERNVEWLRSRHGKRLHLCLEDIRNAEAVMSAVSSVSEVYHLAAQVAVTDSVVDPRYDFDVNLRGTLNVLEAARTAAEPPSIVFTSTNKVFGDLEAVALAPNGSRYEPADEAVRLRGIGDEHPLTFHSPYGCSKGGADQYVLDYARSYGLATVVFRMSCIYGPHQMGTEDQGWVAHFMLSAMRNLPITLYGDGMQVRDILFVEDLVSALCLAQKNSRTLAGRAFTIGGGPRNAISLRELLKLVESVCGKRCDVRFDRWRTGDQRYFVADTSAFRQETAWAPQVNIQDGLARLHEWISQECVDNLNEVALMAAGVAKE